MHTKSNLHSILAREVSDVRFNVSCIIRMDSTYIRNEATLEQYTIWVAMCSKFVSRENADANNRLLTISVIIKLLSSHLMHHHA